MRVIRRICYLRALGDLVATLTEESVTYESLRVKRALPSALRLESFQDILSPAVYNFGFVESPQT